jgi:hypothetical protein
MMQKIEQYQNLFTNLYKGKPRLDSFIDSVISPLVSMQNIALNIDDYFDVDTAVGLQLDAIAEWVGVGRLVDIKIDDLYFSWDKTVPTGWGNGVWKGIGDPDASVAELSDDDLRALIKGRIVSNNSGCSLYDVHNIITTAYPVLSDSLQVIDNQNMTFSIDYDSESISRISDAIIKGGLLDFKPAGISVIFLNEVK